jgi:hypothetical protein
LDELCVSLSKKLDTPEGKCFPYLLKNYATVKKNPSWMDETQVGVGSQVQISVVCGSLSIYIYFKERTGG